MGRYSKRPDLFDSTLRINISKLKGWGYLKPGQIVKGNIRWEENGNPAGSISIQVNAHSEHPYIELDYQYRDEPRRYKVRLVTIPSNLGKGKIWYFLCPVTKKRCRVLYCVGGYFLHREAFTGCFYGKQIRSKHSRRFDNTFGLVFDGLDYQEQIKRKHFKTHYAGRPTKRYLRLLQRIKNIEKSFSPESLKSWDVL
jgi:hypothetical protein